MKYTIKNLNINIDYKMREEEHGLVDAGIEEITVELDKSEFVSCYDAIKCIVKDAVNAAKEIKTAEFAANANSSNSRSSRPYKWGKREDKEVFTKK